METPHPHAAGRAEGANGSIQMVFNMPKADTLLI
jgi:hypothetical protein